MAPGKKSKRKRDESFATTSMETGKVSLKLLIDRKKKSKRKRDESFATTSMETGKVSLKLLIDRKSHRVLFGEAGKDFVDFLFHILSLPLSTIVSFLSKEMVGSLGKLKESIETLSEDYIQSNDNIDCLLNPEAPNFDPNVPLLSYSGTSKEEPSPTKSFFGCSLVYNNAACRNNVTEYQNANCPTCGNLMTRIMNCVVPPGEVEVKKTTMEGGYVKGLVTFMVMDDLVVKPMSTISSVILLSSFNVKDLKALEERVVFLGKDEALMLLKCSLFSEKVLTSVFLGKKKT